MTGGTYYAAADEADLSRDLPGRRQSLGRAHRAVRADAAVRGAGFLLLLVGGVALAALVRAAAMTFLWPSCSLLLVALPILVGDPRLGAPPARATGVRFSSLSLVREALPRSSCIRRHLPFALFALGLASLVVALARPAAIVAVPTNQTTSCWRWTCRGSMCSTDIPPNRLAGGRGGAVSSSAPGRGDPDRDRGVRRVREIVQAPTNDQRCCST